ncbi:MAG: sulfate adenylyltransferase subunit CysD [Phycisphaerae bacterium]
MDRLDELANRSIHLIREAYARHRRMAMLWSIGKDSTTLLWLCRKAFMGRLPFPVLHIDTSYKFPEIYAFRDEMARQWGLEVVIARNDAALAAGMSNIRKLECCNALKTDALKAAIDRHGFEALLLGIRRDEHGIRAKERYFSPRDSDFRWDYKDQPMELWDQYHSEITTGRHYRIHPLLHWTELDVWSLIRREELPVVSLYFAKNGKRYRSIGCQCCCTPIDSEAATVEAVVDELKKTRLAERAGRAQDKEDVEVMQKLRALGYM